MCRNGTGIRNTFDIELLAVLVLPTPGHATSRSLPCMFIRASTRWCFNNTPPSPQFPSIPLSSFPSLISLTCVVSFSYMMADSSVAFKSQVLITKDSGEAADRTATRGSDGGLMTGNDWEVGSRVDNGPRWLEISWGFDLDKGRRAAMEDAIAIVPQFLSAVGLKHGGEEDQDSSVHYFGLFDGHGGSQVLLFVISNEFF